ncbi:MAG: sigma-E processing peptidase SpoIIGA [Sarcina sp.]
MTIYIDVLLLENFLINFFLLTMTLQILSYDFKNRKIFLSSILGSFYTLVILFDELSIFTNIIFKVLVVLIMIKIILSKIKIIELIKSVGVFFFVSVCFSGFCFMFAMAENPYDITKAFTINNYSSKVLLFSCIILYLALSRIYTYLKKRSIVKGLLYELRFIFKGQDVNIRSFLDTGNELVEPATGLPVIIIEKGIIDIESFVNSEKFIIPYRVVNGMTNKIEGIKISNVMLKGADGEVKIADAVIGITQSKLSRDGSFQALLPRGIL